MKNYRLVCEQCLKENGYMEQIAGDITCFRYPYLNDLADRFAFDKQRNYWRYESTSLDDLREIASRDLTLYEFLVPEAKKLHIMDMAGVAYGDDKRQVAFEAVSAYYQLCSGAEDSTYAAAGSSDARGDFPNTGKGFSKMSDQLLCLKDMSIRKDFEAVAKLYENIADIPVHMVTLEQAQETGPFPFGSMMKGTDLVFTDGNPWNFGQDFLHALYHLKEGIPGVDGDNLQVRELWAEVPGLYALQLAKGRMARRIRMAPSPHPVHFTDYIYLRAYLGQAFVPQGTEGGLHPVYQVIEPSIRLMIYALKESGLVQESFDMNCILAEAVLDDRTERLAKAFARVFGEGSFQQVYDTYSIYEKYSRAAKLADASLLDRVLFDGDALIPSAGPAMDVERIWKDTQYRQRMAENMFFLNE